MSIPERQLLFLRQGEEGRQLARCQFNIDKRGRCVASFTYPVKPMGWRRNVMKNHELPIAADLKNKLLIEVQRIRRDFRLECLHESLLWTDTAEIGNAITKEKKSGRACVRISIIGEGGELVEDFWMREDSPALIASEFYKTIIGLIAPFERP